MIFKGPQAALLILALFGCIAVSLAGNAPGFIYSPESQSSSSASSETASEVTYDDSDIVNMIAHNIGILDPKTGLKESTKDAISKFGSRNIFKQQKINYLFLVESDIDSATNFQMCFSKNHRKVSQNTFALKELKGKVLDLLYNAHHEKSLVNLLKKATNKSQVEAYLYSGAPNTELVFNKNTLSLKEDSKGNLVMRDGQTNKILKLKTDLSNCLNTLLEGKYKINLAERSIVNSEGQSITLDAANQEQFVQFMNDVCSISSVSTLIRRDPNPSFFTFYINSLAKLQKLVTPEQKKELINIFNIAYNKFVQNVKKLYAEDEITGQVLILDSTNSIEEQYAQIVPKEETPEVTVLLQGRILQETAAPKVSATDGTTQVIFKSVLIGFALISLWIWYEMFNMEIQKDTIVYAKFLAADYFRK